MTIYDIAREAGVSASTVSRVINHKPGIKESTRQRVQELLERYHYTPDISARGLVTQASRFIGILIEDIRVEHHTESAYVLEQAMTAKGYTCITFSTGPQPERKAQYIQILEQRRVEGVFLIGSMFGTPEVRQSVAQHMHGIPVVLVNGELDLPNAYNVLADEQQGTADCVALLAEAGRHRPAYLMDTDTPANRNKVCGFRQGLAHCGLHPNAPILTEKDTGPDPRSAIARGRRETAALLAQQPDTDSILCATDLLAIGCLQELQARGIAVPQQVAVAGVDNTLYGQLCSPALTTLDNRLAEVSQTAAALLLDLLQGKEVPHRQVLPAAVIVREST